MFAMRQKYGVGTFYSKHPDVNDYIARSVGNMRKLFQDVSLAHTVLQKGPLTWLGRDRVRCGGGIRRGEHSRAVRVRNVRASNGR